ncbi:hypothetical protein [Candidatus Lokiarchaeum ossiferum]|uniref:hypothetical protein n=1 Tax=Candidatus Lokiarchaeum ossiferum TaxID=2951803 RepID=UPI00352CCD3A
MDDYLDFYLLHLLAANSPCRIMDLTRVINQSTVFLAISQKTRIDRKTVLNRIRKLAQQGYVQLTSHPADHCLREVLWGRLTSEGEHRLDLLHQMFAKLLPLDFLELGSPSENRSPAKEHWYQIDFQERVDLDDYGKTLFGEELLMNRTVVPPVSPQELERVVARFVTHILVTLDIKVNDFKEKTISNGSEGCPIYSSHS